MQPANRAVSASEIDTLYQQTCAQLGQSYLKRLDLVSQLKLVDADIATLKEAAYQHLATYRTVSRSEAVNAKIEAISPRGKAHD